MGPGPEDAAAAEAFPVDALGHGGQQDPLLHEGQQLEEVVVGGQRGRRVREEDARKPDDGGGGRDRAGREVHDPDVAALDPTFEDLLA